MAITTATVCTLLSDCRTLIFSAGEKVSFVFNLKATNTRIFGVRAKVIAFYSMVMLVSAHFFSSFSKEKKKRRNWNNLVATCRKIEAAWNMSLEHIDLTTYGFHCVFAGFLHHFQSTGFYSWFALQLDETRNNDST